MIRSFFFLIGIDLNLVFGRSARMGRACFCLLNRACASHNLFFLLLAVSFTFSCFLGLLRLIFVNN